MTVPSSVRRRQPPVNSGRGCLWSGAGGLLGAVLLVTAAVLGRLRGATWSAEHPPAPALRVLPMPSPTGVPAAATLEPPATPVNTATPAPPLTRGGLVQVFGTGGDGLRLRETPGLGGRIKFLGLESEVFLLRDGPVELDGFSWWLLENPYDPSTSGWAVGEFLRALD